MPDLVGGNLDAVNYLLLALLTILLGAGVLMWLRPRFDQASPGSPRLRIVGGLAGMGLAMLGAALLVSGGTRPLGATLAVAGPILAAQAVLGGDLLWSARNLLALAALLSAGVGFGVGSLVGFRPLAWPLVVLAAVISVQGAWLVGDTEARSRLRGLLGRLEPWLVLLVLAALVRIPVPLWPEGFALISTVQIGLITLAGLWWGWKAIGSKVLLLAGLAFGVGLIVELVGSRTGLPFGFYSYASAPSPTLWGVPLIVPLGWFALALSAHVLAGGRAWRVGLLMVAWDLGLEALMPAKGYWLWHDSNPLWYGAPPQNFLAWFVVGVVLSRLLGWLAPGLLGNTGFAWAYRLEALFVPAGLVLLGLWPAAIICGLTMNALAWRWNLRIGRKIEPVS